MNNTGEARWRDACLAAALLAMAPHTLGGLRLRASAGPVRDAWLDYLRCCLAAAGNEKPLQRIPSTVSLSRLIGGLDLAATLQAGRPVVEEGLLARADGGLLCLAMAERAAPETVAQLCQALDRGEVLLQREGLQGRYPAAFGLLALDEGEGDEALAPALADRLALQLDLHTVSRRDVASAAADPKGAPDSAAITAARGRLAGIACHEEALRQLCGAALALGCESLRASWHALLVARLSAALRGGTELDDSALADAVRLVLAPRATRLPQPAEAEPEETPFGNDAESASNPPQSQTAESEAGSDADDDSGAPDALEQARQERLLAAAAASLPADLLAGLRGSGPRPRPASAATGAAGDVRRHRNRGRPAGSVPGLPREGARLNLLATLRAAAPWQPLRHREAESEAAPDVGLRVRREDFRVTRFRQRAPSTTIFLLDASGSAALHRLAEAKGAVELLLADCYVRRDEVAVVVFRGERAEVLLPPTRSLARAKRELAALPGGGATPLASALGLTTELVQQVQRRGGTPLYVLLSDGRANVALDGSRGREQGWRDSCQMARQLRVSGAAGLVIDTSPRPRDSAAELAALLSARYLPLPHADAAGLRAAVRVVSE